MLLIISLSNVNASKGVGLIWNTQTEIINENIKQCIEYGVYNPGSQEVNVYLEAEGNIKNVAEKVESKPKLIQPGTEHEDAIPLEICFYIPEVYDKDCLIGNYICKQTCQGEEISYDGSVNAYEVIEQNQVGGSAAGLGVSAPLTLMIKCSEHSRDWSLLYIIIIIIVGLLIGLNFYKKYRTPPQIKKAQKIQKLETKLSKMKSNK